MSQSSILANPPKRWIKWLLILLLLTSASAFIWQQLPGAGYSTDLTRVGAGQPTLVLAQHGHYVGGAEVMELMNSIRSEYIGRVEFLVANLQMPDGRAFAERHAAGDGTVMLFDRDGRRLGLLHQPTSSAQLRGALAQAFDLKPPR